MVVNRAKIQNFFSLKSTTWKMLARRAKIRGFPSRLCISEVFRMLFSPKSSTFWGLLSDTAKHNRAKFNACLVTKVCAISIRFSWKLFLPKNRAAQHKPQAKQQHYG
jgi:hypothetical protein